MKHISPKISLITAVIFLLLCAGVFVFIYKKINNSRAISEQTLTIWQTEFNRREGLKSLEQTMKTLEEEKTSLESHFIYSSNVVPFLNNIESLALSAKAKAEVSSVELLKDNSGIVAGIKVTGSFDGVYKFLLLLENSPYEVQILTMNMEKGSDPDPSLKGPKVVPWTATFKIKLLSFVP